MHQQKSFLTAFLFTSHSSAYFSKSLTCLSLNRNASDLGAVSASSRILDSSLSPSSLYSFLQMFLLVIFNSSLMSLVYLSLTSIEYHIQKGRSIPFSNFFKKSKSYFFNKLVNQTYIILKYKIYLLDYILIYYIDKIK